MVLYLSKLFPHTFLGLIQLFGVNVPHGTVLSPDVQTRVQQHSCPTPLSYPHCSGQAADAAVMNRGTSLAAAGSFSSSQAPWASPVSRINATRPRGVQAAAGLRVGMNYGCAGLLWEQRAPPCTETMACAPQASQTQCWANPRCACCSLPQVTWVAGKLVVLWRCVARKRRNPSGQLVMEQLPTHPVPGSRRKSGSGQVVLSTWDSVGSH